MERNDYLYSKQQSLLEHKISAHPKNFEELMTKFKDWKEKSSNFHDTCQQDKG